MARPTDWNEAKEPHKLRLTPTCWRNLDDIAAANSLPSKAEAIEHLSRYAVHHSLIFERDNISIDAIASLNRIAATLRISRSELVERIARVEDERIMELLEE